MSPVFNMFVIVRGTEFLSLEKNKRAALMFDKMTEDHYNWLTTIKKTPDMLEKCFGLSFMDSDELLILIILRR